MNETTAAPFAMTGGLVRRDGRAVLAGVDLRVEAGDVLAVLGPNGAAGPPPSPHR
ncbi:hypothetical protein [Actinomadura sp. NPDC049753]|uniref:hypothetical protein n=1 Tax=Actinomadura sp. NPDC049753 TaxID=3154739 RepID=UPI0034145469